MKNELITHVHIETLPGPTAPDPNAPSFPCPVCANRCEPLTVYPDGTLFYRCGWTDLHHDYAYVDFYVDNKGGLHYKLPKPKGP